MNRENIKFDIPKLALFLKTITMAPGRLTRGTHFHKAVEVIKVHEGNMTCYIEDLEYNLGAGDILLVNSRRKRGRLQQLLGSVNF